MPHEQSRLAAIAWPGALAGTAVVGTLATACMMPLVGLAVVATATMPRGRALATLVLAWLTNQLLGFTLLGYPPTAYAFGWGAALGVAGCLAVLVAGVVMADRPHTPARLANAFAAAFASYEAGLFAFASVVGGTGTFTAPIILRIAANDAAWCLALLALHVVLTRAAPRTFGPAVPLRTA